MYEYITDNACQNETAEFPACNNLGYIWTISTSLHFDMSEARSTKLNSYKVISYLLWFGLNPIDPYAVIRK